MKPRFAAGLVMMLASLPCFGAGGYIISKAMDQRELAARQRAETDTQCRARLSTLGKLVDTGAQGFEVTVPDVKDARKALGDVTAAQALCPHWALMAVCLGESCDRSSKGVTLKFRMIGRQK